MTIYDESGAATGQIPDAPKDQTETLEPFPLPEAWPAPEPIDVATEHKRVSQHWCPICGQPGCQDGR